MKRIAGIKDGVVCFIAAWSGDQAWWDSMKAAGFELDDVTNDNSCQPNSTRSEDGSYLPPAEPTE